MEPSQNTDFVFLKKNNDLHQVTIYLNHGIFFLEIKHLKNITLKSVKMKYSNL